MKGYRLNPNREFVNRIIEGVQRKDGHCPCRKDVSEETLCPCDEFITTGICRCGLFIKEEDVEKFLPKEAKNEKKDETN